MLARRLGKFAEDRILTEAQGGFRSHRRCSDQWLVLRGVYELKEEGEEDIILGLLGC